MAAFISGVLGLGTAIVDGVLQEPSSTTYARQPIQYSSAPNGIALNSNGLTFGPSDGTWGTLTCFGVFDLDGNVVWLGTVQNPLTPAAGSLVPVPVQSIQLSLNVQLPGGVALSGFQSAFAAGSSGQIVTAPLVSGGSPSYLTLSSDFEVIDGVLYLAGQSGSGEISTGAGLVLGLF